MKSETVAQSLFPNFVISEETKQRQADLMGQAIQGIFEKVTSRVHAQNSMEHKYKREEYRCILLPHDVFIDNLNIAIAKLESEKKLRKYESFCLEDYKFVDAGCGTGHKLFLAALLGFRSVTGIDSEIEYLNRGKSTVRKFSFDEYRMLDRISLVHKNIIDVDYSKFDVIYFYVPIMNVEKEIEFEKQVVETAKAGAIIIGAGNRSLTKYSGRLDKIGNQIFVKRKET